MVHPIGLFYVMKTKGNDHQNRKDKQELWRYRLSMDNQLTRINHLTGLDRFISRYSDWYKIKCSDNKKIMMRS